MSMRSICAQLFFAVLVVALFALPRAALAHQGHDHAAHARAMHVHATDVQAQAADTAASNAEQSLTAAVAGEPAHMPGVPCSDPGCCAHGSCAACCSMVAPTLPMMLPPTPHAAIGDVANASRSGIDGPSLRRPPRSFA